MTTSGRKPSTLRADRRYPTKPATAGQRGASAKSRAPQGGGGGTGRRGGGGGSGGRRGGNRGGNALTRFFGGLFRRIFRLVWGVFWRVTVVVALLIGITAFYDYSTLPPVQSLLDARSRGSVTMLDDQNKPFAWRGESFGGEVHADKVSPYLREAIISTEDRRFYDHFGVSPRGIIGAMLINMRAGRSPFHGNGGSTITQQVAKLLCLGHPYDPKIWKSRSDYVADCRQSTLWRKIKEVPYAFALEAKYTKNQILTIYMNRAYLGSGTVGFEAAAERYFGKHASDVTVAEAAMLAGLLKAPSYYAPTTNLSRAQERANLIVDLMAEQRYITLAQARYAHDHPAQLSKAAADRAGGYFADWVMERAPSFLSTDTTEDVTIQTTLDQGIQAAAVGALHDVFDSKLKPGSKAQAAIVVMSPDGAVRAMVGGRTTEVSGAFNRATQALRQTGSAFKPFVFAAALDMGMSPNDIVEDSPLTVNVPGSGPWSPKDFDKDYMGPVTLTTALAHSLNTSAVRIALKVGLDSVRKVATDFGIHTDLAKGPALALGVSSVTLLDMTAAYAGILNGGSSVRPYGLLSLSLRGDKQPLMGQTGGIGERVISQKADQELIYMMSQVVERGTGQRAKLPDRQAAGKTGTTQNSRDGWFIGFTANYVVGVWMGHDDDSPMTGITGGGLPAEIWHEVMVRIDKNVPPKPLPMIVPPPAEGGASVATSNDSPTLIDKLIGNILSGLTGGN
ncbi:MAG: PBP1A family penicillin-binding protein [Paracoccaceae bacterium]|nr:PBP1A family penicillin-binding protein [Paracoccaceae bacterium]